jgi:hypothetical protein
MAETEIDPLPPAQSAGVGVAVMSIGAKKSIVAEAVAVQSFLSSTVTTYLPKESPLKSWVLRENVESPSFVHE